MPTLMAHFQKTLQEPALCEQLPVRDYLAEIAVRSNGAFFAGYELQGLNTYFASDVARERAKSMLENLLRAIPEQSMRMQLRYEVVENVGDLITRYTKERRSKDPTVNKIDQARVERWHSENATGQYLQPLLHVYFIWNPQEHYEAIGKPIRQSNGFSFSKAKCIQRSRQEHNQLAAEFEVQLNGIETAMHSAGLDPRRLNGDALFLEAKRALNPVSAHLGTYRRADDWLDVQTAREQIADVSLLEETENYLNIDGILYSLVSLKDLPDATFPGILRELVALDFPFVANLQLTIPNQAKVLKTFRTRLRKMQAAQRDSRGGFKVNIEAQVAEQQLLRVQQDIISSSVKTVRSSLVLVTRTSQPAFTTNQLEDAERLINHRRQQLLAAVARMNGGMAVTETLAKKRLFFGCLPGMSEEDRREHDILTSNAADLMPVEMPWKGTSRSPLFLLETPYRQLMPFSFFDPGLSDANLLVMATTGGGKTMMAQMLLSMAARVNPLVSIIERGDSYRSLVELMGGRMVSMSLDSDQTINPWDLTRGEREPSKDQVAFLKNLTKFMLGDNIGDADLIDNLLTEAILRTYKRAAIRPSNAIPTFSDLKDELAQWRDEDKNETVMEAARMAALKLRNWTGEKGPYAKLFDRPTTIAIDNPWLYFNVEKLADDARVQGAMSLMIARATSERASGKTGQPGIVVMDEFWFILDSPVLAPEAVQLYRTARKRGVSVWGISQGIEDFVGTKEKPRSHGIGILKNASTKIVFQQPGDIAPLREHLRLNETALNQIKCFSAPQKGRSGEALLVIGENAETTHTIRLAPTPLEYWIMTTYPRERIYRSWWLHCRPGVSPLAAYQELAAKFPFGLADLDSLPEEVSGEVTLGESK